MGAVHEPMQYYRMGARSAHTNVDGQSLAKVPGAPAVLVAYRPETEIPLGCSEKGSACPLAADRPRIGRTRRTSFWRCRRPTLKFQSCLVSLGHFGPRRVGQVPPACLLERLWDYSSAAKNSFARKIRTPPTVHTTGMRLVIK